MCISLKYIHPHIAAPKATVNISSDVSLFAANTWEDNTDHSFYDLCLTVSQFLNVDLPLYIYVVLFMSFFAFVSVSKSGSGDN